MEFRGRSFPDPANIDPEGWAVVLAMVHPEDVTAPDAVLLIADGLDQQVAEYFATMLDRSPSILLDMNDLADPSQAGGGKVWMFMACEVESQFISAAFKSGAVCKFNEAMPVCPDAFRALMTAYELSAGEQSAPDFALPDFEYAAFRRKVLGMRVVDPGDREALKLYADFVEESRKSDMGADTRLDDLAADIGEALEGRIEVSSGLYCVVIDTNLSFRVGGEVRKAPAGFRSVVVAHGLTVRQAAFLYAVVSAAPADFLLPERMVPKIAGDEEIFDLRIVAEDQLGWVGVDLTGVRNADTYDQLVEVTRDMANYGLLLNVQEIAEKMVAKQAGEVSAAMAANDRSR